MTEQNERDFAAAVTCHICDKPLDKTRVRDHDHISSLFRGAAHNKCNLNYRFNDRKENFLYQ